MQLQQQQKVAAAISAPSSAAAGQLPVYTREQVAQHRTEDDCWMVIHGVVYNLTALLEPHPGGRDVLLACAGGEASEEFEQAFHPEYVVEDDMPPYVVGRIAE